MADATHAVVLGRFTHAMRDVLSGDNYTLRVRSGPSSLLTHIEAWGIPGQPGQIEYGYYGGAYRIWAGIWPVVSTAYGSPEIRRAYPNPWDAPANVQNVLAARIFDRLFRDLAKDYHAVAKWWVDGTRHQGHPANNTWPSSPESFADAVIRRWDHYGGRRGPAPEIQRHRSHRAPETFAGYLAVFMHAERIQESGDDYRAVNPGSGAGGAYQFMPGTWQEALSMAGYARTAWYHRPPQDAPPSVQDDAARALMGRYYHEFGSWRDVAEAWYAGPGNVGRNVGTGPTSFQYAADVIAIFERLLGGKAPPAVGRPGPAPGGGWAQIPDAVWPPAWQHAFSEALTEYHTVIPNAISQIGAYAAWARTHGGTRNG